MKTNLFGKIGQAQYLIPLVIGLLALLYWISPGAVTWIGRAAGNIVVWVVTNVIGAVGSLITGLATAVFG